MRRHRKSQRTATEAVRLFNIWSQSLGLKSETGFLRCQRGIGEPGSNCCSPCRLPHLGVSFDPLLGASTCLASFNAQQRFMLSRGPLGHLLREAELGCCGNSRSSGCRRVHARRLVHGHRRVAGTSQGQPPQTGSQKSVRSPEILRVAMARGVENTRQLLS